ncbi:hypothetical protein ACJIZ3_016883 [Penstemon smallii]|uniref:F-box domain-containing protein n=1 Tax=Penstemon smallii TaxID=265156 RepID=A0ABD3SU03_9LAMI
MSRTNQIYTASNKKLRLIDIGGDRISNLPDDVISQILSCLSTRDSARTCVLSKNWEHKWTSIYNIQIDDACSLLRGKVRVASFVSFVYRILFTHNSSIKSFRLTCKMKYEPIHLTTWISTVLRHKIQNLEITARRCRGIVFPRSFSDCNSLTELKLMLDCTLKIPVDNCFPNLKNLYLGGGVKLLNDQCPPNNGNLRLSFPLLEVLVLKSCRWLNAKVVEINAPSLTRFEDESSYYDVNNSCSIMICGTKLTRFESSGGLINNYVVSGSSVSYAVLNNNPHVTLSNLLGPRAQMILKGFLNLKHLILSSCVLKVLTELKQAFPLPIFSQLNQLELLADTKSKELLELLQVTPSLESLILDAECWDDYNYEGVEVLPPCIMLRLKEFKLNNFQGTTGQINLAKFIMKNAENLEKVFVTVGWKSLMSQNKIKHLLSTFPKSSVFESVVVIGRKIKSTDDDSIA